MDFTPINASPFDSSIKLVDIFGPTENKIIIAVLSIFVALTGYIVWKMFTLRDKNVKQQKVEKTIKLTPEEIAEKMKKRNEYYERIGKVIEERQDKLIEEHQKKNHEWTSKVPQD